MHVILILAAGLVLIGILALLGVMGYLLIFALSRFGIWLELKAAGVPLTFGDLLMIRFQHLDERELTEAMKTLWKAGIRIPMAFLQSHVLAGGSLNRLVQAAIAADKAGLAVDYRVLAAIDLAGRDILDAVKTSVSPKVLVCPQPGSGYGDRGIIGITQDGVSLGVKVRITVRMRLDHLVGGAGEGTVIARVGEGIVSALGRAGSHKEILERPELIAENILARGLDAGTCFEILSVDIANVDVLENVSARLAMLQAHADKRIAQAKAASAKANAMAQQQEMKAVNLKSQALVVAAKVMLPKAFQGALQEGRVGRTAPCQPLVPRTMDFWHRGLAAFTAE